MIAERLTYVVGRSQSRYNGLVASQARRFFVSPEFRVFTHMACSPCIQGSATCFSGSGSELASVPP
ncbi:MAG: hypothetical protein WBZ57_24250, partial [Pseudomonas graminis]